jgi:2,3-bisphosphoglycerate-independent phosphoglycerate mutase
MKSISPVALIILDGFGYRKEAEHNAIAKANTPHLQRWLATYPHTLLAASGTAVGLLPGTIGNSEVGHLTIGSGRAIPKPTLLLHEQIQNGSFFKNPVLLSALEQLKQSGRALHLMGLLSDAGVHSHEETLYALIKAAREAGVKKVYIHPFLDGRDVPPRSALLHLKRLTEFLQEENCGTIATIHGRYYGMDRDNNWERTYKSYQVLTEPQTAVHHSWERYIQENYDKGIDDEFIPPFQVDPNGIVQENDGIIFFNVRADRARQITECFISPDKTQLSIKKIPLSFFIGATDYGDDIPMEHLITQQPVKNTLKEVLTAHDKKIFSVAETEKYAHVTYFFAGGKEEPFSGETRRLIPSIKTKDYVHHPEMSAAQITDAVLDSLQQDPADFYLINYANADMVGHSGNFDATVKAVEFLDHELARIYNVLVEQMNGMMIITADHGNAENMWDTSVGQAKTSHTVNPVPFVVIQKGLENSNDKITLHGLADIAPFILKQMNLEVPKEMIEETQ